MAAEQHAFGIDLTAERPIPGLPDGHAGGRPCRLELVAAPEDADRAWTGGDDAELLRNDHYPDGRLFMSIAHSRGAGYRIEAPGHGLHVLTPDGGRVTAWLPDGPDWRYQVLLFAQTLPLAATLRGIEVLHAGAVAIGGQAVGIVAASGTGKSTVNANLVAQGAEFLTDDALGLERRDGSLIAHPGPRFANLHADDLAAFPPEQRVRLGDEMGSSDKVHVRPRGFDDALPLAGLYFLWREGDEPLRLEPLPDAGRVLLASTFVTHARSTERLINHMDICAEVAATVRCVAVRAPLNARGADVAAAILDDSARRR